MAILPRSAIRPFEIMNAGMSLAMVDARFLFMLQTIQAQEQKVFS